MQLPALTRNAFWVTLTFGLRSLLRLASNVALSRLLFPEAFGIMAVVNSLRTGMELLTDVGVGQNIVTNANGASPDFFNTAWTVQIIRGLLLALFFALAAPFVSSLYEHMDLLLILYVFSLSFVLAGFQSTGLYILQRTHRVREFELFGLYCESATTILLTAAAYFYPSVWVLVIGGILGSALRAGASHLIGDAGRNRMLIVKAHLHEIVHFGKWVALSSVVFFLATNFDRLYLAKAIPLEVLGVYGVARSLTDVVSGLVARIANLVAFPLVSSMAHLPRAEMMPAIGVPRLRFLLIASTGLALAFSASDLVVDLLYDTRYSAAAWMVPVLLAGVWFSILSVFAEAMLLGLGNPQFMALANTAKLVFLVAAVPLGFALFGTPGALVAISASDLPRYIFTIPLQIKVKAAFFVQDFAASLFLVAMTGIFTLLRQWLGLGTFLAFL